MHISFFSHPERVTQAQWELDMQQLPPWRQEQARSYRFLLDRVLCTKAYLLLRELLATQYGMMEVPEFSYTPYGKPYLKDYPNVHFNLSHCPGGVLCVCAREPVGCDVEVIPATLDSNLMEYCFNEAERDAIARAPHPCAAFTQLWTQKEAFLKLIGTGLNSAAFSTERSTAHSAAFSTEHSAERSTERVDSGHFLRALFTSQDRSPLQLRTTTSLAHRYVYTVAYYDAGAVGRLVGEV